MERRVVASATADGPSSVGMIARLTAEQEPSACVRACHVAVRLFVCRSLEERGLSVHSVPRAAASPAPRLLRSATVVTPAHPSCLCLRRMRRSASC